MYLLFVSSFALLVPVVYSCFSHQYDITYSMIICFLTSICNHGFMGSYQILRIIDVLAINGLGGYYSTKALYRAVYNNELMYAIPLLLGGMLFLCYWTCTVYYTHISKGLYKHAYVHVLGAIGVCVYSYIQYNYNTN